METKQTRTRSFSRRAFMLGGVQLGLSAMLAGRLYQLQVIDAEQYQMQAEDNRISLRILAPSRGSIYDRNGDTLATNRQNFRVRVIGEETDNITQSLMQLAKIVPVSDRQIERVIREVSRSPGFVPVTVLENLDWREFSAINVRLPYLGGIDTDVGETREYPFADVFAHLIGYVGPVAPEELTGEALLTLPGFRIGKIGIERAYESELRGRAGSLRVEVNAFGREVRELQRENSEHGEDIVLSISSELQHFVHERVSHESASVVVMDIHRGDVLAIASTPAFDPNAFNVGLTNPEWEALLDDERTPLVNKAVTGLYSPGSTLKMIVALAALEAGIITERSTKRCTGSIEFGGRKFHCWKEQGHGSLALVDAITQSCDVYFYEIAREVGVDRIADTARRFGLGTVFGIEIPGEKAGLVPTRQWKLDALGERWQPGETLNISIGQGYITATPLQLAVMTARLANGGKAVKPRLVLGLGDELFAAAEMPDVQIDRSYLKLMTDAMNKVVNDQFGTAFAARLMAADGSMAGKTGTVQVRSISMADREAGLPSADELPWKSRDHAIFVGYAPVGAPRFSVSVVVEHGGGGSSVAAPIARDILRETLRLTDRFSRPTTGDHSDGVRV